MLTNDHMMSRNKKMPILQINFKLNVSPAEYLKIADSVAQAIADAPGLVWKVWLLNEEDGEAGGIYLFQDEQSLAAYLSSPIIGQIKRLPQLREISAKWFETIPELTVVTRGPIPELTELKGTNQFYEENVHVAQ
jgi:Putative mono-oxygenase ydhR